MNDMDDTDFKIRYHGHERQARELLLKKKLKTAEDLSLMTSYEVEQAINAEFEAIETGDDWLLIPQDKYAEFNRITEWICR